MSKAECMKKIVAVSDSLTNDDPGNWLALMSAQVPGIEAVAEAHGGWTTTSYFKAKFDGVAFAKVPRDADLFIVLLGSNNLFEAQGGDDAAVAEATAGVDRIAKHVLRLSPGAAILLAAPPTVAMKKNILPEPKPDRRIDAQSPRFLGEISKSYRALAGMRGWLFVDLFPLLGEDDFADAAHPNDWGNRKMADAIGKTVADWMANTGRIQLL